MLHFLYNLLYLFWKDSRQIHKQKLNQLIQLQYTYATKISSEVAHDPQNNHPGHKRPVC